MNDTRADGSLTTPKAATDPVEGRNESRPKRITTDIKYARWSHPETSILFDRRVKELASECAVLRVCDVGGGANPQLPLEFIREHGLEYTVVDISADELAKRPTGIERSSET